MVKTYIQASFKLLLITLILLSTEIVRAQNTVSIGTTELKSDAVLWLNGTGSQGLLLPVADKDNFTPSDVGMMIYDSGDNMVYFWTGAAWQAVAGGSGGGADNWGTQVAITAAPLTGDGTAGSAITLADGTSADQILVWDGATWGLEPLPTGGGSNVAADITYTDTNGLGETNVQGAIDALATQPDSDNQELQLTGTDLAITGGNSVDLSTIAGGGGSDDQDLQFNAGIITLENDPTPTSIDLSNYDSNVSDDVTALDGLTDVNTTGATNGQVLEFNGGVWQPATVSGSGDMLQSVYDNTGTNGIVDDAENLGGAPPTTYLDNTDNQNLSTVDGGTAANINISGGTGITLTEGSNITFDVSGGNNITINSTGAGSLPVIPNEQILISNGTSLEGQTVSGDISITNTGVTTITAGAITGAELANGAVTGGTGGVISDGSITEDDISSTADLTVNSVAAGTFTGNGAALTNVNATSVDGVDVDLSTAPTDQQVLKYDLGSNSWVAGNDDTGAGAVPTLSGQNILIGDGSNNTQATVGGDLIKGSGDANFTVVGIQGQPINAVTPTPNQVLQYVSGEWVPSTIPSITDEVNVATTNSVPRFNGTQLVDGSISDDGSSIVVSTDMSVSGDLGATGDVGGNTLTFVNTVNEISTDGTLADDSDSAIPTEQAVKTYVDANSGGASDLSGLSDANIVTPSSGQILVYDGTTEFDNVSMGGDINIDNTGATTIQSGAGDNIVGAINNASTTGTVNIDRITSNGSSRAILANGTSGNVQWVSPSANNQVLGSDGIGDLTFRNVIDAGTGIASPGSDANLVTEAAVRAAIDAAGGFNTANEVPRGDGSGLVSSNIFSDGTNVGIGVPTPTLPLELLGTARFDGLLITGNNITLGSGFNVGTGATGGNNAAVGFGVLGSNSGSGNAGFGSGALFNNDAGILNTGIGNDALINNISGSDNTAMGGNSLQGNILGSGNTTLGARADVAVDNLNNATAIGLEAMVDASNTVRLGRDNTAVEFNGELRPGGAGTAGTAGQFLQSNGTGNAPTWVPAPGGGSSWNLTGNAGTIDGTNFIGTTDNIPLNFRVNNVNSGRIEAGNLTANTFLGYSSGSGNTGEFNTGFGWSSLQSNTGHSNTAIGSYTMLNNVDGFNNTAIGRDAMRFNTSGAVNTAVGGIALYRNTTGSNNVAVGGNAMVENLTGSENVAVGTQALQLNTTGIGNTATGFYALLQNTSSENVAMGTRALADNTTGTGNTALGYFAGYTTAFANANTTGSNNTFLGYNTGPASPTQLNNATAIGANTTVDANNTVRLGVDGTAIEFNGELRPGGPGTEGTAGQFLQSNGTGNAPTWEPAPGGGSLQSAYTGGQTIDLNATDGDLSISATGGTPLMLLEEATGNVGIGTATPTETLEVVSSGTAILGTTNSNLSGDFAVSGINTGTGDIAGFFWANNPSGGTDSHGVYGQADGQGSGVFGATNGTTGAAARFQTLNAGNTNPAVSIIHAGTGSALLTSAPLELTPNSLPGDPINKLYNVGGALTWNGIDLTAGGGGSLQDAYNVDENIILTDGATPIGVTATSGSGDFESLLNLDVSDASGGLLIGNRTNTNTEFAPSFFATTSGNNGWNFRINALDATSAYFDFDAALNNGTVGDFSSLIAVYNFGSTRFNFTGAGQLGISPTLPTAISIRPYGAGAGNTSRLEFRELAANGNNVVGFQAPDALSNDVFFTLPSDNISGVLTNDGFGTLSWGSSGGISDLQGAYDGGGDIMMTPTDGNIEIRTTTTSQIPLFIEEATGSIGLGTNAPENTVHIFNAINAPILKLDGPTNSDPTLRFTEIFGTDFGFDLYLDGDQNRLKFRSLEADVTVVDDILTMDRGTGNIGIGTTPNINYLLSTFGGNVQIGRSDGSDVGLVFNGDNNGISWMIGNEDSNNADLIISTGSSLANPVMFLETTGDIGIGNTNPNALLSLGDLYTTPVGDRSVYMSQDGGDTYFETGSGDMSEGLIMHGSGTGESGIVRNLFSSGFMNGRPTGLHIFNRTADPIIWSTNDTEQMRISSTGIVGVGTSNPLSTAKMEIETTSAYGLYIDQNATSGTTYGLRIDQGVSSGTEYGIYTAGEEQNYLSANTGIGTAAPVNRLDVEGSMAVGAAYSGSNVAPANGLIVEGNVGIGTNSLTNNTKFQVDDNTTGFIARFNQGSASGADGIVISAGPATPTTGTFYMIFTDAVNNFSDGSIQATGSGGIAFNTTSDRRLKQNISDIENPLETLMKIRPRDYEFISNPEHRESGFIAQELVKIYPQAVSGDPEGDVNTEPMMVDYSKLTPLLTGAIQEQQEIIETQKKEIEALKAEIAKSRGAEASTQTQLDEMKSQIDKLTAILTAEASKGND